MFSHSSRSRKSKISIMGLKSRCRQGWLLLEVLGENPFLPSSSFCGLLTFFGLWLYCFSPCPYSFGLLFCLSTLSIPVCIRSPSASLLSDYMGLHEGSLRQPRVVSLSQDPRITPAKTLFPDKVKFTDARA